MVIYVGMVLWIILASSFSYRKVLVYRGFRGEKDISLYMLLTMGMIVFFIGLRSAGADTYAYISMFENLPIEVENIRDYINKDESEVGFYALGVLIKTFISTDYHVYLFIIASISGFCIAYGFWKYAYNLRFTMLLFMLTGTFTWMINGIRQFLALAILFAFSHLIFEKKHVKYMLLVLALSTIHTSIIVMLPVSILVSGKPWNKKTILVLLASIITIFCAAQFTDILGEVLENTDYAGATEQFLDDDGVNPIRVLINSIPCILSFIHKDKIRRINDEKLNVFTNFSILTTGISLIAMVTSGILMGRLVIYFSIYNLIFLPGLISVCYCGRKQTMLRLATYSCYTVYFFYQNFYVNHYYYISDILQLNLH